MADNLKVIIDLDLSDFSEQVQKAVRDEITTTGLLIETTAKRNTPVDTGRLRASLSSQSPTNDNILSTSLQLFSSGRSKELNVGSNVEYAGAVEYGSESGKRPKKTGKMPFLRPAFLKETKGLSQRIIKIIEKG